jgi:hypothetical protein
LARYFFHLRNHTDEMLDLEGMELPLAEDVNTEALRAARDLLSHETRSGVVDIHYRIDVEEADGGAVHSLSLKDAFELIES